MKTAETEKGSPNRRRNVDIHYASSSMPATYLAACRGSPGWKGAAAALHAALPTREEAESLLAAFDEEQQRIAKEGFGGVREGLGGGTSAAKWAAVYPDWPALRNAVLTLTGESERVMLGICAEDAFEGVAALKEWVSALQLPRYAFG